MTNTYSIIICVLFVALNCSSCHPNRVGSSEKDFSETQEWYRKDTISSSVQIDDKDATYDLVIWIRHTTVFPYSHLGVRVAITNPDGATNIEDFDLKIRSDDDQFLAEGSGDLWDIETVVKENMQFNTGNYKFQLIANDQSEPVVAILNAGIFVEKRGD